MWCIYFLFEKLLDVIYLIWILFLVIIKMFNVFYRYYGYRLFLLYRYIYWLIDGNLFLEMVYVIFRKLYNNFLDMGCILERGYIFKFYFFLLIKNKKIRKEKGLEGFWVIGFCRRLILLMVSFIKEFNYKFYGFDGFINKSKL